MTTLDERDAQILAERQAALDAVAGPRVGDYVVFADGVCRRISHLWPEQAQTSDGGSFYLGDGYVSFSGSLHAGVPLTELTDTGRTRSGSVWFFHHREARAHNGVDAVATFRVFSCPLPAPI